MKPLSKLRKPEIVRLGEMTHKDFSRAGVEDRHIPYVCIIAQRLKEAVERNSDQLERDALGKNASWGGSRRRLSDPVRYLEHNAHKAARRDDEAALKRPLRLRDVTRQLRKHP